jgi:hypothetical protein
MFAVAYHLCKTNTFDDVLIGRNSVGHSHDVQDQRIAEMLRYMKRIPGWGALTYDILLAALREMAGCTAT